MPARLRDDWRREWHGELAAAADAAKTRGAPAPLVRHALGVVRRRVLDPPTRRRRPRQPIDDLRHGWRQLRQHAGFAITAVGILALSMAASVTAFSVVSQILLRPLPYPDPDRIVTVWERQIATPGKLDVAPGNFLDWRARAHELHAARRRRARTATTTPAATGPKSLKALNVTEGFFDVFGVKPLAGRFFRPDEHKKGNHQVVVLSARFWRSHFGADPDDRRQDDSDRRRARIVVVGVAAG